VSRGGGKRGPPEHGTYEETKCRGGLETSVEGGRRAADV